MRPSSERLIELKRNYHVLSVRIRKIAAAHAADLAGSGVGQPGVDPIDDVERIMRAHSARLAVILEAIARADADPALTGEAIKSLEDGMPALEQDLRAMEALAGPVETAVGTVRRERTVN